MLARLLAAMPLLAAASLAGAQADTISVGGVKWKPIDQGFADRGPLSFSLRDTRVDMRQGMDFDRVYQLDGKPRFFGGPPTSDYFMRISGGLSAIFPRSAYTTVGPGIAKAEVPSGTIYSIGGPIHELVKTQPDKSSQPKKVPSNRVDLSAPKTPPASASQPASQPAAEKPHDKPIPPPAKDPDRAPQPRVIPASAPPAGSIWNNEDLRKQRVGALLDEALRSKK